MSQNPAGNLVDDLLGFSKELKPRQYKIVSHVHFINDEGKSEWRHSDIVWFSNPKRELDQGLAKSITFTEVKPGKLWRVKRGNIEHLTVIDPERYVAWLNGWNAGELT